MLQTTTTVGPGGKNMIPSQYETLGATLLHKRLRLDEAQQQAWVTQLFPKEAPLGREESLAAGPDRALQETRRRLDAQLREYRRVIRNFESDPSVKHTAGKLKDVLDQLEELQQVPREASADPSEMIVATMREEIHAAEEAAKALLGQLRETMPEHQKFLALAGEARAEGEADRRHGDEDLAVPDALRDPEDPRRDARPGLRADRPRPPPAVGEHRDGDRPQLRRWGSRLVCLLEHLDHSVKVPEHLTVGLTLPLLGVVPRIRRTSLTHRGGHLWASGAPDSVEADAYRNLRASLLGASDRLGPIVHPAGHQRQGRRGQEHDRPEPGRHLRPGRRADPVDGRRPPPAEPRRGLPTTAAASAWSTSSGANSPGSGRSSAPTSRTSTSCRPATPATSRSRSSARWSCGNS